jgi:hypothetical protein
MSEAALGLLAVMTLIGMAGAGVVGYILGFSHGQERLDSSYHCINCGEEVKSDKQD